MSGNGVYSAYSFADFHCALITPTDLTVSLSEGGIAEEGITIALRDPVNVMTAGADGSVMHSLRVFRGGTITVRALKTGSINARLSALIAAQSISAGRRSRSHNRPCANCWIISGE